jgi:hypothetical protein
LGDYEAARALTTESLRYGRELKNGEGLAFNLDTFARLAEAQGERPLAILGSTSYNEAWAAGSAMSLDDAIAAALGQTDFNQRIVFRGPG